MANDYLVGIHCFLSNKIEESEKTITAAKNNGNIADLNYYSGKRFEFLLIRNFMDENFNLKTQRYY